MKEFWGDMDLGALLENDIKDPTERDLLRSQAKNNFSHYKKKVTITPTALFFRDEETS